jgi:lipoprotein-releasing system ATP-binding protein
MTAEAQPVIRAETLTMKYRSGLNDLTVFADVSFDIQKGESIAVVGASGAGKSTLLHLLGGLDRPTSGKVFFEGQNVFDLSERGLAEFRNRELGFVWQQASLLPEFTALENVAMPLYVRGMDRSEANARAAELLKEVGLADRTTHRAGELSGGEQQRVSLARALVGRPKVLLADEPTGNLDERTGEQIAALLGDLHKSHGLTSMIVTHNLRFARGCDRVLQLEKGTFTAWHGEV